MVDVEATGLRGRAAAKRAAAALVAMRIGELLFRYRFESLERGWFEVGSAKAVSYDCLRGCLLLFLRWKAADFGVVLEGGKVWNLEIRRICRSLCFLFLSAGCMQLVSDSVQPGRVRDMTGAAPARVRLICRIQSSLTQVDSPRLGLSQVQRVLPLCAI